MRFPIQLHKLRSISLYSRCTINLSQRRTSVNTGCAKFRSPRIYQVDVRSINSETRNGVDSFVFPKLKGNILVVGDGDFGYSVALAKAVAEANKVDGNEATVTATSLDTKDIVENKYPQGKNHLDSLESYSNVCVTHGIDATKSGKLFSKDLWDSIIWNFPYPPFVVGVSAADGRTLLTAFLSNARTSLKQNASIYVTLYSKQATEHSWNLDAIACDSGYVIAENLSFCPSKIDGYEPKRAYIDQNLPIESFSNHRLCTTEDYLLSNIFKLLEEADGELNIGTLKRRYEDNFGALARGRKFKEFLEELSHDADFHIELRKSSPWIISNRRCLTNDIRKLLEEQDGEILLCILRNLYKQHFRKSFPTGKPLKKQLEILSANDKRMRLESRKGRSEWWIVDEKRMRLESRKGRRVIETNDDIAEKMTTLLKDCNGKLRGCRLREIYRQRFGTSLQCAKGKLKKRIEQLSTSDLRFEVEVKGRRDWWIVLTK